MPAQIDADSRSGPACGTGSLDRVRPTFAFLLVLVVAAVGAASTQAGDGRFDGHVSGVASGPGHSFIVGNGLNLVFQDRYRAFTRYRVCWTRGAGRRCWRRTTGSRGRKSVIFTAAPSSVGTYTATWYVAGTAVTRWSFYNGPGD